MKPVMVASGLVGLGAAAGAGLLLLFQRAARTRSGRGGAASVSNAPAAAAPAATNGTPAAAAAAPGKAARMGQRNPGWRPGGAAPPPYGAGAPMLTLDPATHDKASMYAFVISAVVPRPVAFVTTLSAAGVRNLAPYSYFNVMCHNPPVVTIGVCRSPMRGGGKKDTLQNIEETGEFVVNIISDWYVEAANHTSGEFAPGVDEMAQAGLTPAPSQLVKPPRVAEAAVQLECRLRAVHEVLDKAGNPSAAVVIGEVVLAHVAEAVTARSPTGKVIVDPHKLRPVGRLGGVSYCGVEPTYDMPRPDKEGNYPPGYCDS